MTSSGPGPVLAAKAAATALPSSGRRAGAGRERRAAGRQPDGNLFNSELLSNARKPNHGKSSDRITIALLHATALGPSNPALRCLSSSLRRRRGLETIFGCAPP